MSVTSELMTKVHLLIVELTEGIIGYILTCVL